MLLMSNQAFTSDLRYRGVSLELDIRESEDTLPLNWMRCITD